MSIWIKFEMLLFLNALTGSIAYLFWRISNRALSRYQTVRYLYAGLKLVILLFAVPLVYVWLFLYFSGRGGSWKGYFMTATPAIVRVSILLAILWTAGALRTAFRYGKELYLESRMQRFCREDTRREEQVLAQLCREMEIKKRIGIRKGTGCFSPSVGGLFRTRIYLGDKSCGEEELRVILRHELIHCRHRDVQTQRLLLLLGISLWFHPLFWNGKLYGEYRRWSEDCVDISMLRLEDKDLYIRVLLKTALACVEGRHLAEATAAENESDVLRRIEKMKGLSGKKKITGAVMTAWIMGTVLFGGTAVYASGSGVVSAYRTIAAATEEAEEGVAQTLPVYGGYPLDSADAYILMSEASSEEMMGLRPYWTVGANMRQISDGFRAAAGTGITVNVSITPEDFNVKVGIINPDGKMEYIEASNGIAHSFTASHNGIYKFYIENGNGTEICASGTVKF